LRSTVKKKESQMISTTSHIKALDQQLIRLGLDDEIFVGSVQSDVFLARIYDDHDSGIYPAEAVMEVLKECNDLSSEDLWALIASHETEDPSEASDWS
jgi:hypothetical protein